MFDRTQRYSSSLSRCRSRLRVTVDGHFLFRAELLQGSIGESFLDLSMELRLTLIRSPTYPDTINVDDDLQDYFNEPRQLKLNDQITIRPLLQPGKIGQTLLRLWTEPDVHRD
jgi:hypothetical protein